MKEMFLPTLLACFTYITASPFILTEDACSTYDSCKVSEFFRTCSCYEDCSRYGTCCYDASTNQNPESFDCYSSKVPQPVYAKRTCSTRYRGSKLTRNLCMRRTNEMSDLMANVLVYSNRTKTTYWNYNCAMCNGEIDMNLSFWTVQATFPLQSGNRRLDLHHIRNNMIYSPDNNEWGVMMGEEFIPSSLDFFQPPVHMEYMRYCTDGVISTCSPDWDEPEDQEKCHAYYGERKSRTTGWVYRNVHCALCNGVSLNDLECSGRNYMPKRFQGNLTMIRVVFNLNSWTGEHTKGYLKCRSSDRYDPFFRQCRPTRCGIVDPSLNQDACSTASDLANRETIMFLTFLFLITVWNSM